ncbi:LysE family translocator [Photobacterium rosenbergii]|uniref:LysE family translocator n=1 Tax=Photobacterium rosenbergii TaxID=294936 RepID=A0ABU3ZEW8_9GAMM|nr:LysE family translocator [Photobacterium rosenbergii]MDV5168652.1 LysE family translocator [Photobacterium rosenbergii]
MALEVWIYYVLAVLVLTASPGPSSLLCMTKGVSAGWKVGAYTALGSLTAITSILTLSFTGLGVIIASSELFFNLVKWVGAGYLIYLGVKSFTSNNTQFDKPSPIIAEPSYFASHFISGFIVGASNPKAILFFTALFPQFINPSNGLFFQYVVFAVTFVVLELSWLLFYAYLGSKSSNWVFASGRAKMFNRLTGGVFIGAGALLSTVNRS